MKLVMLMDGSTKSFEDMIDVVDDKSSCLINTQNCDEDNEYRYLLNGIKTFAKSKCEVMLAKFSGKESIAKDLGDECSEMILTLSDNKKSKYYTECPKKLFLDIVSLFEKGDF